jgi:hypothetical protein
MTKNWACRKTCGIFRKTTNRTAPRTDVRTLEHLFDGCEDLVGNFVSPWKMARQLMEFLKLGPCSKTL